MNILKKIFIISLVLIAFPVISLAATVSCVPQYSEDYIGKTVTWNGEITNDSDLGDIISYNWSLEEDSSAGAESPFGSVQGTSITNIYNTAGTKHATFLVTGASSSAEITCSVLIYDENTLPILNGSCIPNVGSAVLNQPVVWTSSISGGLAPYTINWGGDASGSGDRITENYIATGTKVAQITNIASRYPELPISTSSINCSPSVNVYSDIPAEVFTNDGTTCSASESSINTGGSATWSVDLKTLNGTAPYIVSWTGSDDLSGNGMTINKTYSLTGVKTAKIYSITSSDGQSIESEINCLGSISVNAASSGGSGGGGGSFSYSAPIVSTSTSTTTPIIATQTTEEQVPTETQEIITNNLNPRVLGVDTANFNLFDPYIFNSDEFFGSFNEDVANLQNRLKQEGFFNSNVTGFFGSTTKSSIIGYQKANGLEVTGNLDQTTRSKLNGIEIAVATSTNNNLNLTATVLDSFSGISLKWTLVLLFFGLVIIFFILWKNKKDDKLDK